MINGHAVAIADELLFQRMLVLERLRCERAGTRFGLVLVDFEELHGTLKTGAAAQMASAIGASMRETDIVGWYRQSYMIGIILTALNETPQEILESAVTKRIRKALSLSL